MGKKDEMNEFKVLDSSKEKKERHWFIDLSRMVGWILLMLVSFVLFFQILPVVLLAFGHITLLFGSTEQVPSVIDVMVYIPTAVSLSGLLTYILYRLLKKQYAHVIHIQNQLSVRFATRYADRRAKKSKK